MIRYSREYQVWYDDETGEEFAPPDAPVSRGRAVATLLLAPLVFIWVMESYGIDVLSWLDRLGR